MYTERSNIVLIGMPGSGKSTAGVLLAKKMSKNFVDTDLLIQVSRNLSLQEIVNSFGHREFLKIEEKTLKKLRLENHVIATGGSAVYSQPAMNILKTDGVIVFLDADLPSLKKRLTNFDSRGIARRPGQNLEDLFEERNRLYHMYADITVDCSDIAQDAVCGKIMEKLRAYE